jgi:TolB-like protein/tetratricopeptide (TPR) repeat protein/tRNA A-37 threonylcarbamoyl transferase component Bud32
VANIPERLQASLGSSYTIERDLGGGGMSQVYVALDQALGRRVVVKILSPTLSSAVNTQRFDREIKLAARLQHAHIVPLLTAGESDGLPFFTMPFVDGQSLQQRIHDTGPMPVPDVIRMLRDVASALDYAHEHGIVHRDIKPANILLSRDSAVVTDFGVAKAISESAQGHTALTSLGVSLGTPAYMAPEQAAADPAVDHRADIYSFGVTAYEMLAGKPPFHGMTVPATLSAHMTLPPEPIWKQRDKLPPVLSALVMRCLEKDPADRPQSAAELSKILDEISAPSPDTTAASRRYLASLGAHDTGRRRKFVALAAAGVVVLAVGLWAMLNARGTLQAGGPTTPAVKSIAVLPFSSADSSDEYFRDGMADQLIVTLSAVPGLSVASRTSAFTFKDRKNVSAAEIGRVLNVDNILEGSVRRAGDRLRVLVQLTNARDGSGLWSETFETRSSDVFAMQDSISRAILDRLRVRLTGNAPTQLTQHGTAVVGAYDLYLRALHQFNKFEEGPLRESIRLYNQAIELDPRYAQAWAGIAKSWLFLADDYVAPRIAYPAAKQAAEQALSYDSTLAEAHAARATALYQYEWKLDEGRREMDKAMALDSKSFLNQIAFAGLLMVTGKSDSAITVLETAQAADPLSVLNALLLGRFYGILGRQQEAIDEYQRAIQLAPPIAPIALTQIGEAQIAQGRTAEADTTFDQARTMLGPDMDFLMASGEAARGRKAEARRLAAKLEAVARQTYVRPDLIAGVYARLGDKDKAFAWLDKGYEARSPYMLLLPVDRQWDAIRDDPRFARLVQKVRAR